MAHRIRKRGVSGLFAQLLMKKIDNNEILQSNSKKIYIEMIRIFACLMVIVNHTNGLILENGNFLYSTFYCITFALCKTGVTLFLMISGALLLDKNYSYKKILKCIIRVVIPVIGVSFILYVRNVGLSKIDMIYFIRNIIAKPYIIPYWYIYALIGIYIALPFLQKMIKNLTLKEQQLFIIIFLLIPTFINTLKQYLDINISPNLTYSFFPTIIVVIVCGYYVSKIKLTQKKYVISIFSFVLAYILMFCSLYLPYLMKNEVSYKLDSWNVFPVIIMSISLFIMFRYRFEDKKLSSKVTKIIQFVGSTTFGIYLIHYLINYKLYELEVIQYLIKFNSIFGIIILDLFVFIFSMVIIAILKKVPIIKKFL